MSIGDMFLKVQGVTGEASDADHKGEIDIVSWSWGMYGQSEGGLTSSKARYNDLQITKRVDRSSVTLMQYLRNHKIVDQAVLTVRKAGTTPLEYLKVELNKVRVRSLETHTDANEVMERIALGFASFTVIYVPQSSTGAMGGGALTFTADVEPG
jgi:type VI secretion system secreted protein Hcp